MKRAKKLFLNLDGFHTVAAIAYELKVEKSYYKKKKHAVYGTMYISDCSRVIEVELSCSNEEQYKNSVNKLLTIQRMADEARQDLEELWEEKLFREKKEAEKENKATKKEP